MRIVCTSWLSGLTKSYFRIWLSFIDGRKIIDGSSEDKVLDVQIHLGWKSGTKIRFAKAGNELPPMGDGGEGVPPILTSTIWSPTENKVGEKKYPTLASFAASNLLSSKVLIK